MISYLEFNACSTGKTLCNITTNASRLSVVFVALDNCCPTNQVFPKLNFPADWSAIECYITYILAMLYQTYSKLHLGDNLVHLNFLRKLSARYPEGKFVHATTAGYLPQLREVIKDIPAISLIPLEELRGSATNAWTGAGRWLWFMPMGGFRDGHPNTADWSGFHVDWFRHLAAKMGLESPIEKPADLLFDYPAIQESVPVAEHWKCDVLVINSRPASGQLKAYKDQTGLHGIYTRLFQKGHHFQNTQSDDFLAPVIDRLCEAGHQVVTTQPYQTKRINQPTPPCTTEHGLTVTNIGNLSLRCKYIVMISTGPIFPTLNVWNVETVKLRVVLLDCERLNLPGNMVYSNTAEGAMRALKAEGLI